MLKKRPIAARRPGVAMLLVLFAVTVVFVLTFAMVATQSVSVQLSRNIATGAQARTIAESGLEMAVTYILGNENWRTEQEHGAWIQDYSFAGGTFTVYGEDGEDTNNDGIVEGDGDLANNSLDLLTVTVVGTYQGTKHTVRTLIFPPKRLMMIVPDVDNLTFEDSTRLNLLRDWGWAVSLLRARASKAEFDTAVADVHIVYFPAQTKLEGDVKDKLKLLTIPIIIENQQLVKELRIADGESKDYAGTSTNVLELSRTITADDDLTEYTEVYKHYITEPFPVGLLTICSVNDKLLRLDGKVVGAQALTAKPGDGRIALAVLESGALKADKKPSRARCVALPWGRYGFFSIASLNDNGRGILRRALDWSGSSWVGLLPGLATWDKVEIKDSSMVDGFNSGLGPYGGDNVNAEATVSTNSTKKEKIKIEGGTLFGSAYVGPNSKIDEVVQITGGGQMTGQIKRMNLASPVPDLREPTDMGGEGGNRTYSTGLNLIDQDLHLKRLTIKGDAIVEIVGDVTILCQEEILIQEDAQLRLAADAALTIYSKKDFKVENNARVNVDSADPTRLNILILKKKVEVKDGAQMYASVQGYDAELKVKDNGHFYGTFIGKTVKVENSGAVHVDTANSGTITTMGSGLDLRRITGKRVRWLSRR